MIHKKHNKKMEVVNSYIKSYNNGNLKYKGAAYKRLLILIEKFFVLDSLRNRFYDNIKHSNAKKREDYNGNNN
tara:strand:- start:20735 stop:20953 length:219 start_codon:yes stop_codon:yes gene_type:complete